MVAVRTLKRSAIVLLVGAALGVWNSCADGGSGAPAGPPVPPQFNVPDFRLAMAAQRRYTDALLATTGVVGTATTRLSDGRAAVLVLLERPDVAGVPPALDGVPVALQVTGRLMALSDPTKRQRPAPAGFSVGHPSITAGTIGARVRDALGRVYILSNNHVLANSNGATIGDPEYQPGPFDGGTPADQIATLSDFQTITFTSSANNTIDAAIALSDPAVLDNATPADDGYGMPNASMYGDANGDGLFDDRNALLGLTVQKYGRTTHLTHGTITGVNATVTVCYEVSGIDCTKSARFVDQIIIGPGSFSGGGDSGSLIVTDDANLQPVALLFAGSSTVTIANRIDLVLLRFGVAIDGFAPPPPGPLSDLAVTGISGPSTVVVGSSANITVLVKNVGNQNVTAPFDVTVQDSTTQATVGTQSVAALAAGASVTLTFPWSPASSGDHILVASHSLADDRAANDRRSVTMTVTPPVTDLAVTSLSVTGPVIVGHTVSVAVAVGNVGNQTVVGNLVVTLRDQTAGVTLGTQSVAAPAVGGATTLNFSWNTTGATTGAHTLVASHDLSDDNAANNQRSTAVSVNPKPTDLALTNITAPARVTQGEIAHVVVTVKNVGEVDVGTSFSVVLTDGTAGGATLGSQPVPGLAMGDSTMLDFPWNTAGADTTGHILFATQTLADDNSTNNSLGIGIIVKPGPVAPTADVAVTALTAPSSAPQGSQVSIGVTVQNVGGQGVGSSFDVTLTDQTAGATLGTQTVAGLAAGASATLSFNWSTTSAVLGGHTLVASHNLIDANGANNTRSGLVTLTPQVTDLALIDITAPAQVTQGDVAPVQVTVRNVGGLDVASVDVVLTDGSAGGVTLGTQTITGLAVGASATRTFNWNTTGASTGGHILIATQKLADNDPTNNAMAIGITVKAPPLPDVAVTGVSAPPSVAQGNSAAIGVTVQNVSALDAGTSFNVVLTDQTAGVTLGSQTVASLAAGAVSMLTFTWNTTAAALGGHTLVASHSLADANAGNNQGSAVVTVNPPLTDVAVTAVNAPSSVTQGTTASIGVTVQNVGGQVVTSSFTVVLTDQTAGVTLGAQTVNGLAAGAGSTLSFSWNTTNAALGGHTLVATHGLADDNAANNQASATATIAPQPTDLALTDITAPSQVTQGDVVPVVATVQNVGGQSVTTSFDVVLTDGSAGGVTIGTQTVAGLAVGASATRTFNWNTAGVATGGHILIATQKLADNDASNNARAMGITVNAPSIHVGNLGGAASRSSTWRATVTITTHDWKHSLRSGVTVRGSWNGSGATVSCTTGSNGTCNVVLSSIPLSTAMVTFAVTGLTRSGYVYNSSANHDPDGSSNGFSIIVKRP